MRKEPRKAARPPSGTHRLFGWATLPALHGSGALHRRPLLPYLHAMAIGISPERMAWLEREVAGNEWHSPAEAVDAALHAHEKHLAELRQDLAEADAAIDSGNGIAETAEEFLARMRAKQPSAA